MFRTLICALALLIAFAGVAKAEIKPLDKTQKEDAKKFLETLGNDFIAPLVAKRESTKSNAAAKFHDTVMPLTLWKDSRARRSYYHCTGYEKSKRGKISITIEEVSYSPLHGWVYRAKSKRTITKPEDFAKYVDGESFVRAINHLAKFAKKPDELRRFGAFLFVNGYDWQANFVLTLLSRNFKEYLEPVRAYLRLQHGWNEGVKVGITTIGEDRRSMTLPFVSGKDGEATFGKEREDRLADWEKIVEADIKFFIQHFQATWDFCKKTKFEEMISEKTKIGVDTFPWYILEEEAKHIEKQYAKSKAMAAEIAAYKKPSKRVKPMRKIPNNFVAIQNELATFTKAIEEAQSAIEDAIENVNAERKADAGDAAVLEAYKVAFELAAQHFPTPSEKRRKEPRLLAVEPRFMRHMAYILNGMSEPTGEQTACNKPHYAKASIALYTLNLQLFPENQNSLLYRSKLYLSLRKFKECQADIDTLLALKNLDKRIKTYAERVQETHDREIKKRK